MYPVSETLWRGKARRPASEKISMEARRAANARIGGLLNCQASAPVSGRNSGPIWKRVFRRAPTSRRDAAPSHALA